MTDIKNNIFFTLTKDEKSILEQYANYYNMTMNEYIKRRVFNIYIQDQSQYKIINILKKLNGLLNYSFKKAPTYTHTKKTIMEYKEQYKLTIVMLIYSLRKICNVDSEYNVSNKKRLSDSKKHLNDELQDIYFDHHKYNRDCTGKFTQKSNKLRNVRNKLSLSAAEYNEFKKLLEDIKGEFGDSKLTQTDLICSKLFSKRKNTIISDFKLTESLTSWGYQYKDRIKHSKIITELTASMVQIQKLLKEDILKTTIFTQEELMLNFNNYVVQFDCSAIINSTVEHSIQMKNEIAKEKIVSYDLMKQEEFEIHNTMLVKIVA